MKSLSDILASGFGGDASAFNQGDVTGPASSTDNTLPRFDGTTGKLLQGGLLRVDDLGNIFSGNTLGDYGGFTRMALGGTDSGRHGWVDLYSSLGETKAQLYYYPPYGGTLELRSPDAANGGTPNDNFWLKWSGANAQILTNYGPLVFMIAGSERARITADGRWLIGTTSTTGTSLVKAAGVVESTTGGFKFPDGTTQTTAGVGDVVGPASATDNHLPRFDGTTGKLLQSGLLRVDDIGNIYSGNAETDYAGGTRMVLGGAVSNRYGWVQLNTPTDDVGVHLYWWGPYGGTLELRSPDAANGGTPNDNFWLKWSGANAQILTNYGPLVFMIAGSERARITADGRLLSGGLAVKTPFTLVNHANCTVASDSITPTGGGSWGTQSAYSVESYTGDVSASCTVNAGSDMRAVLALNSDPTTDSSYTSLDFGVMFFINTMWYVVGGSLVTSGPAAAGGDTIGIRRIGTAVEFLHNGSVYHTETGVSAATPLYLDTAFENSGSSSLSDISFGPPGMAKAKVDGFIESRRDGFKFPDRTIQTTAVVVKSGITTVNFGAFPGASDASVAITGQSGIVAGSKVKAWIIATATADHSPDEHWVETLDVMAGNIVPGTGFTIYAKNTDVNVGGKPQHTRAREFGGGDSRLYGQFTVAWEWI